MTEQLTLTDKERELVALGAAIGAGCQPCTQYHVKAAVRSGLSEEEVGSTIDKAEAVRREGGIAVSNVGRQLLGIEQQPARRHGGPSTRDDALTRIGAAAGCNAAALLSPALEAARDLGLSGEELRSSLEIAEVVKQHAAQFLRRDAERAMGDSRTMVAASAGAGGGCCGAGHQ